MDQPSALSGLLDPKSIAIVGASNDPNRIGGRSLRYMLERPFDGVIYPINPKRNEVQGVRAYDSVTALPEAPDVAILALSAALIPGAIAELAAAGVGNAVIFSSGFAEAGEAGVELQRQIIEAAGPMRILGPNSLGLFNARRNFWGTFTAALETGWPLPGRIGLATQSGAYGAHMLTAARNRGIGTSSFITTGNEADVTVAEAIAWLVEDDDTDVIVSYIEGIRDGPKLVAALEAARGARKPVVMLKSGRSSIGSEAAQSHTASLAGDDAVADAVLRELGVLRVNGAEEALDLAMAATKRIYPVDNTLGVLTVSGGAGILIADDAEQLGLPMPAMPQSARARMQEMLAFASTRNPVDCTAQALNQAELTGNFGIEMVRNGGYKSLLIFFSQAGGVPSVVPGLREQLRRIRDASPDVLHVLSVLAEPEVVDQYAEDGFLVYEDPGRAVRAIAAMGRLGEAFAPRPSQTLPVLPPFVLPPQTPNEAAAKRLMADVGIQTAPEVVCDSADAAVAAAEAMGYPVVMKILSPDILHKSEIGGVLVGIEDAQAVRDGFETLLSRGTAVPDARLEGVLVARQIRNGVECVMGIKRDPSFGPIILFGLGGIHVEVLRDFALRRCPIGLKEAMEMIRSIRTVALLDGVRGSKAVDMQALAEMLSRLSVFAANAGPALQSIDLNPVIATPDGAWAADAVLEIDSTDGDTVAG